MKTFERGCYSLIFFMCILTMFLFVILGIPYMMYIALKFIHYIIPCVPELSFMFIMGMWCIGFFLQIVITRIRKED